jgi:hypothetical protein
VYRLFDGAACESPVGESSIFPVLKSNATTCYLNGLESTIFTCEVDGDLIVKNFNGTVCEGLPYKVTTTQTGVCVPATLSNNHSVAIACVLDDTSIPITMTPIQFVGTNITLPIATYCNLTDGNNCTGFITAFYSDSLCSITSSDIAQSVAIDTSICYYDPSSGNRMRLSCSDIACTRSVFAYDCVDSHYYGEQVVYLNRCVQIASASYQQSFYVAPRQTSSITPTHSSASSLSSWQSKMVISIIATVFSVLIIQLI